MPQDPIVTVVLPPGFQTMDLRKSLRSLIPLAETIQIISAEPFSEISPRLKIETLSGNPPLGMAPLINRALEIARGEFMAVLAPGIEVAPDLTKLLKDYGKQHKLADYFYGDYEQVKASGEKLPVQSNSCPEDVTEREDWGPLEIYRTNGLRRIGGCDEGCRFRPDYDLRLKLTDEHPGVHMPRVLCSVAERPADQSDAAAALFFPGRGKFGGFSYLFMNPEEEKEIEEIFYSALRRRGAFSEKPPGAFFPAPSFASPRVSVIIPIHNRPGFLPLSVSSVQRGTFQDFEIIIVDNASTDNTLDVANNFARQDGRLRVISLLDNVIAKALNAAVRQARGEYIAQLDSDDEYMQDTLQSMVRHLDEHLKEALAISYYELMDPQGRTLEEFGIIKHLEYNRNNILRVDGAGAVRVWRKAAILEFGGFNEADFGHYGEDYDLVLKVGEKYEVGRAHEVLYRYRRHPGNSDVLRPQEMKIRNKTLARRRAIERRRRMNQAEES